MFFRVQRDGCFRSEMFLLNLWTGNSERMQRALPTEIQPPTMRKRHMPNAVLYNEPAKKDRMTISGYPVLFGWLCAQTLSSGFVTHCLVEL